MRAVWGALRLIRSLLLTLAAVLGVVGIVGVALSLAFDVKFLSVVSGSMEPGIPTGSLVWAKQAEVTDLRPGDIITVARNSAQGSISKGIVTHRVVSVELSENKKQATVVLRGDANPSDDPAPYVIGGATKYFFHVPYLGSLSLLLQTPLGIAIVVLIAALLVFIFFMPTKRTAPRPGGDASPEGGEAAEGSEASAAPSGPRHSTSPDQETREVSV